MNVSENVLTKFISKVNLCIKRKLQYKAISHFGNLIQKLSKC